MELEKLNALYEAHYGSSIPGLGDDVAHWTFHIKDFDSHLSLYRFRLSLCRDACARKNSPETVMAELDEYEKMLDKLESSTCRNLTNDIVSSPTHSTHICTDREGTTIIACCSFTNHHDPADRTIPKNYRWEG